MGITPEREAELAAQGWQRRSLLEEPRLSEAAQAYRDLGFAVHLEPVDPNACQSDGDCSACLQDPQAAARLGYLFTRPAGRPDRGRTPPNPAKQP